MFGCKIGHLTSFRQKALTWRPKGRGSECVTRHCGLDVLVRPFRKPLLGLHDPRVVQGALVLEQEA